MIISGTLKAEEIKKGNTYKELPMIANKRLVLNSIVYCLPGMVCEVISRTKKYHTFRRIEKNKPLEFKVSNDLVSVFFRKTNYIKEK